MTYVIIHKIRVLVCVVSQEVLCLLELGIHLSPVVQIKHGNGEICML